jgi:hypothetical protein
MNFYRKSTEELFTEEELIAKYGTNQPIPELGIEPLDDVINRLSRKLSKLSNEKEQGSRS